MPRPRPTPLYHFTHVDNLPSIVTDGLLCEAASTQRCVVEVGNRRIKEQRRRRPVRAGPGGSVGDYVPFYFAPRSPMLYAVNAGQVEQYAGGQGPLVYLVTSVERLGDLGLSLVFTDRNAALATGLVRFTSALDDLDDLVDWPLMADALWFNTPDDPERRERRMAECLAHGRVPWDGFTAVAATARMRTKVTEALARVGAHAQVEVRPKWYF
ncbi:MAG: DUF4433 domain-containing protein [Actinomycetota bacterium]